MNRASKKQVQSLIKRINELTGEDLSYSAITPDNKKLYGLQISEGKRFFHPFSMGQFHNMTLRELQNALVWMLFTLENIDLKPQEPEFADEEIIDYDDIEEHLFDVFGIPHENSAFYDSYRENNVDIWCAMPDEIRNDTITSWIYETGDVEMEEEEATKVFLDDYKNGNRWDTKYRSFPMNIVLFVLAENDKIKHGSYRLRVSY